MALRFGFVLLFLGLVLGAEYEVDPRALDQYLSHVHESQLVQSIESGAEKDAVVPSEHAAPVNTELSSVSFKQPVGAEKLCGGNPCSASPYSIVGRLVPEGKVVDWGSKSTTKYDATLDTLVDTARVGRKKLEKLEKRLNTLKLKDSIESEDLKLQIQRLRNSNARLARDARSPKLIRGPQGRVGKAGRRGKKGYPGNPGRPGEDGPRGWRGATGPVGKNGANGANGRDGRPGQAGAKGPTGPLGYPGLPGANGERGPTGLKGPPGARGLIGLTGVQGPPGFRGAGGYAGPSGPRGPYGKSGPRGPPGPEGADGIKGWSGRTGRTGPPGETGPRGFRGKRGPTGPVGRPGDRGYPGPAGAPGPRGIVGASGARGRTGPRGRTGTPGAPGTRGVDGRNGVNGKNGRPGSNGDRGRDGPRGARGRTGVPGPEGDRGRRGAPGVLGARGPRGFTGLPGKPGARGPRGKRGARGPRGPRGSAKLVGRARNGIPNSASRALKKQRRYLIKIQREIRYMKRNRITVPAAFTRAVSSLKRSLKSGWKRVRKTMGISSRRLKAIRGKINRAARRSEAHRLRRIREAREACPACTPPQIIRRVSSSRRSGSRRTGKIVRRAKVVTVRPPPLVRTAIRVTNPVVLRPSTTKVGLTGTVINFVTNTPVPGVTVTVKNKLTGEVVKESTTNNIGNWGGMMDPGNYIVLLKKSGFVGVPTTMELATGARTESLVTGVNPVLPTGAVRFVVTWGDHPKDLDSWLIFPNNKCKIIYYNRVCKNWGTANLDLDATNGNGPETITMTSGKEGTYQYQVNQYTNDGTLANSEGKVMVFTGDSVRIFRAAKAAAGDKSNGIIQGKVWKVLKWVVDKNGKGKVQTYE